MIVYGDILGKLLNAGYSSYRIQKEKLIPCSTLTRIRHNESITTDTIETICRLCNCQPGDLMKWVPDENREE